MNQHMFERGLTGNCKKCGYIENHTFHMPSNTSIPIRESIVDKDFKDSAFEKLKSYKPSSATVNNHKWYRRYLEVAKTYSKFSKDPSTKTGAVIVDKNRRIVSAAFNGLPVGIEDTDDRLNNRELKYKLILHAEENAIIMSKSNLVGCTIFVYPLPPCMRCGLIIIQSGISKVVSPKLTGELRDRWGESCESIKPYFKEANICMVEI